MLSLAISSPANDLFLRTKHFCQAKYRHLKDLLLPLTMILSLFNRPEDISSDAIPLKGGYTYYIEGLSFHDKSDAPMKVGVRLPSSKILAPIPSTLLRTSRGGRHYNVKKLQTFFFFWKNSFKLLCLCLLNLTADQFFFRASPLKNLNPFLANTKSCTLVRVPINYFNQLLQSVVIF